MIPLYFSDGKAYVWNIEDWMNLRKNFRIIGELIGCISVFPRHEGYHGFPMALMSEEAALLVEKGICSLEESDNINNQPDEELLKIVNETEKRLYAEQVECMKDKRVEQISSRIDMIVAGKQKKLALKGMASNCNREAVLQEELQKLAPLTEGNTLVQIPIEHPWPLTTKQVSTLELRPSIASEAGIIRYRVFKDLWNKGHHISAGTKFGGDFLVYPGDPVKFHAMYIIKCVKDIQEEMHLPNIVAFGRLGVSVNKLTVFAYLNCDDNVAYQTLQWHDTLY